MSMHIIFLYLFAKSYVLAGEDGTDTSLVQKNHAPEPVLSTEKLYAK